MADLLSASQADGELATTDDRFIAGFAGGALDVLQPANGYRAGLDAVLLAAACRAEPGKGETVLDAGAGAGVVGLCVARRVAEARVTLVERAPELARLARRNAERNGLAARAVVIEGDIRHRDASLDRLSPETFDHVVANPPYLEHGRGRPSSDALKAGSHAMAAGELDDWLRCMARLAAPGGRLAIIHRADALPQLLAATSARFGAIEVLPIHPRAGAPAHRILVSGRKGSRAPLILRPGLVLHGADDRFLPPIEAVLREGAALA